MLADAVPVPSSSSFALTRGRLWADDRVSLSNAFSSYTVTFDIIDASIPLVATLVWWDAPVSIVSPIIIANDFDLTCFPPNGTKNQFAVYTGAAPTSMHVACHPDTFLHQETVSLREVLTARCIRCPIASTGTSAYLCGSLQREPTFAQSR